MLDIKVKSNLRWPGGKSKMIKTLDLFMSEKVDKYLELFTGGGSVLLYVVQKYHPTEIIANDIDSNLIGYYNCVKNTPHEIIKEIAFMYDTSVVKTSIAESVAYVDTAKKRLFHTLTQKGEIEIKYDTILNIQFVDRIIEKDVPIEVEIIKYKRDALFWVLVGWVILCLFFLILKMFVLK